MCMSTYGTKATARNWPKKVQETMATLDFSIGKASPVKFCHPQRSLKCLVHGDDFVVSGEPVDLGWMRNELESKVEIGTTILGDEPGMSKEVKILNRKLCWHDGVGISCEADRKHTEAIIRGTGARFFFFFENPNVQREQGDCARQDRRHCGEEKVGTVGHEGTTIDRKDFEPCRDHSEKRFGSNFQFSCHRQRRLVY